MEKCSRNRIQAAADCGNILVNGKPAKSSYKVKPLDRIQIVMPYPRREVELVAEDIPLDIPYEDQWLLLVDSFWKTIIFYRLHIIFHCKSQ